MLILESFDYKIIIKTVVVIESLAVRQRDLIDEDDAILLDQDPEVTPGFFEGDMAGIYHENEVND